MMPRRVNHPSSADNGGTQAAKAIDNKRIAGEDTARQERNERPKKAQKEEMRHPRRAGPRRVDAQFFKVCVRSRQMDLFMVDDSRSASS